MERIFNLIDEPWIRVLNNRYEIEEVSLKQVFASAHLYKRLSGEMEAQDIAVLRFLLALLYSVFARYDIKGGLSTIEDEDAALDRWQELWESGQFPMDVISMYLEKYHDRFWLIDDQRPFYQVIEAEKGTYNSAAKLNGAISESNNKVRMFSVRAGFDKESMTYQESARWLLYLNGFDDTAAKPKGKNLPSPGAGWLGKLGMIYVEGTNLFETLNLNLIMLKDGRKMWAPISVDKGNCACWELERPRTGERVEITIPDNLASLYSLQSRRILLKKDENRIVGYYLLGGDFFSRENSFNEQMTLWRIRQDKELTFYTPRRHDPSRQMWREFSVITDTEKDSHRPGVVNWLGALNAIDALADQDEVKLKIVSVQYGDKDFFVTDSFSDSLTFHYALIGKVGEKWREWIKREIKMCDECSFAVKRLAEELEKASGNSGDISDSLYRERFYTRVDPFFRNWLIKIDPSVHTEEYILELRKKVKTIALNLGQEMVVEAGPAAFRGRYIKDKGDDSAGRHYSSAEAYNSFIYRINKTVGGG